MDKQDKIIDQLNNIRVDIAVTHEKIENLSKLEGENKTTLKDLDKRVDVHDKALGAVVIAVGIITTLIKFKVL